MARPRGTERCSPGWCRYTVEARPTGRTASFYREPPWRPLIETAGVAIAGGREQVLATIWATNERAESDTASDVSSEPL